MLFLLSSHFFVRKVLAGVAALFTMMAFGFYLNVQAQSSGQIYQDAEAVIERIVSELDPESSEQQILEIIELLEDLAANPVNINRAGIDDLSTVPGINLKMAQAIISYRETIKPFERDLELEQVDGIGSSTLEIAAPFITAGSRAELNRDLFLNRRYWTHNSSFESLARYQRVLNSRVGYSRPDTLGGYLGNPATYNHRFKYRSNRLSVNLTQDKDPGEPVIDGRRFDFTSWHLAIQDAGRLKNLVVGDYKVSFGQGLTLWNGGGFGKSSQITGSAMRSDPGIRPYTSFQETNGFRGLAVTYGSKLQFSGFYSNRRRTASKVAGGVRFPTSSALHRTESEMSRRLNLGQKTFGGRVRYQFRHGVIGISGVSNRFDQPVVKGSQPYQLYGFEGDRFSLLGTDFRVVLGPAVVFGEIARSDNDAFGAITGSEIRLFTGTDVALAYRNYAIDFHSMMGSGFGEQSRPQNEAGFYTGIQQQILGDLTLSAYFDFFRTHGARFRNTRPTSGTDWLIRFDYRPRTDLSVYAQIRSKQWDQQRDAIDQFGRATTTIGPDRRFNARLHFQYQVRRSLRLRTRFDLVQWNGDLPAPSQGYLIYQDIRITPLPSLTIDARITLFETDDFNSRVFQFENDLLYVMSNAMLFDQGQRLYLVLRYQPVDPLVFRMKLATTLYENRQQIGSGLDMIEGNRKSDLGVQVQIKF